MTSACTQQRITEWVARTMLSKSQLSQKNSFLEHLNELCRTHEVEVVLPNDGDEWYFSGKVNEHGFGWVVDGECIAERVR